MGGSLADGGNLGECCIAGLAAYWYQIGTRLLATIEQQSDSGAAQGSTPDGFP